MVKYICIVMDKHYGYICSEKFETKAEAIDFMQTANNKYGAAHFFAIDEVEQYDDGFTIRRIIDDVVYVGNTSTI